MALKHIKKPIISKGVRRTHTPYSTQNEESSLIKLLSLFKSGPVTDQGSSGILGSTPNVVKQGCFFKL